MQKDDWNALTSAKTLEQNKRRFNAERPEKVPKKSPRTINPWWFFILFLMGMTFLWVVPKIKKTYKSEGW